MPAIHVKSKRQARPTGQPVPMNYGPGMAEMIAELLGQRPGTNAFTAADFLQQRKEREEAYANGPVPPATYVPRWVIPATGWKPDEELSEALHKIDRNFELIHDPLTRQPYDRPERGIHLYTVRKGAAVDGSDLLILETELTWHIDGQWRPDDGRAPGMWIVRWVQGHLKDQFGGDDAQVARRRNQERKDRRDERKTALAKRDLEAAQLFIDEVITPNRVRREYMKRPVSVRLR